MSRDMPACPSRHARWPPCPALGPYSSMGCCITHTHTHITPPSDAMGHVIVQACRGRRLNEAWAQRSLQLRLCGVAAAQPGSGVPATHAGSGTVLPLKLAAVPALLLQSAALRAFDLLCCSATGRQDLTRSLTSKPCGMCTGWHASRCSSLHARRLTLRLRLACSHVS